MSTPQPPVPPFEHVPLHDTPPKGSPSQMHGQPRGNHWVESQGPKPLPKRWPEALLCLACLAVLVAGFSIQPDPSGMGTHQQLGLSACQFKAATGLPCATCGMTTSVSLLTHGRPVASFLNQPLGMLFGLTMGMLTIAGAWSVVTGMRLSGLAEPLRIPAFWLVFVTLLIANWGYKIWIGIGHG